MGGLNSKTKYKVTPAKPKTSKNISVEETNGKLKHLDCTVIENKNEKSLKLSNGNTFTHEEVPKKERIDEWSYSGLCSKYNSKNYLK